MSQVRIPADPWPFRNHRTWAQVLRTDELIAQANAGVEKFTREERGEFGNLLIKARRFNPPPSRGPEAA